MSAVTTRPFLRHAGISRSVVIGMAALLLAGAVLTGRMLLGARRSVARAHDAARRGDRDGMVLHLRRAMAYYVPGNPWVREAQRALVREALRAEAAGEHARALEIWGSVRGAILQLRGAVQPFADTLPEIDRHLAALTVSSPDASTWLRSDEGQRVFAARLARPDDPDRFWAAAALLGFIAWVAGACWLLARGISPDGRVVGTLYRLPLALVACGFALFCVGLRWA